MGVETTNKALSSLEHGAGLDVAKLPELACALECTLTYLVGLTDAPDRWQPDAGHWPDAAASAAGAAAPRALAAVTGDRPLRVPPGSSGPVAPDWPETASGAHMLRISR